MSILSSALNLGKTALGFLNPAGSALKLAPWIIAAALALGLYIEHERLVAADANIHAAQAQTAQAVQKCQSEVQVQAAKASAVAAQDQAKADAAASNAELALMAKRAAENQAANTAQQALGQQLGTINAQATQHGQDGPIPPVLGDMFP